MSHGDSSSLSLQEEGTCDRRISRAARKLLHSHLLQMLDNEDNAYLSYSDFQNVWSLLEHWLAGGQRKPTCSLEPSLDWYRVDEEHVIEIDAPKNLNWAYPTQVIKSRPKLERPKKFYKCGYCGKTFSSRYYLDSHFQSEHQVEEDSKFCPAEDWCRVVGGLANCQVAALEDEPYYDQGSDGWGTDGKLVKHKFTKMAKAMPCSVDEIRADCHSILEQSCGITKPNWCNSLTCPSHHHFWDSSELHLQKAWAEDMEHPSAILVSLVCFGLFVFLMAFIFCLPEVDKNNEVKRKRLVAKKDEPLIVIDQAYRLPSLNTSKRKGLNKKD